MIVGLIDAGLALGAKNTAWRAPIILGIATVLRYLQIKEDAQVQVQIEQPFWDLVNDAKWKNVSIDMAEAIDRRDTKGRDPSFYAAKALESTIKIISDDKGWTTGSEKGAANYLDNLGSKANGQFIAGWERELMKKIFSDVRNDLGHGPGSAEMPTFTDEQIDFTIEFCMSSIKGLIKRLQRSQAPPNLDKAQMSLFRLKSAR